MSRRGIALIVVLFIAAFLTILLYAFLMEMQSEAALSDGYANRKKAEHLALSAVDKMAAFLAADTRTHMTLSDGWSHSETEWYEVALGEEGVFSAIHPAYKDDKIRWGLVDEASKININVAPKEWLLKLPGMTEEIADSILDWRDPDDNANTNGAESSYYATLQPAYQCKNAPFETIEELLFVRGVTAALFWGEDRNQNGILDSGEDQDLDGTMDWGFYPFVTVWSTEKNVRADGAQRLDVNTGRENFQRDLGDVLDGATIQRMRTQPPYQSVAHVLDVQGMSPEKFKKIVDRLSVAAAATDLPGLVNVNTAPRPVLMCLPNVKEEWVDAALSYRTTEGVDLSNIGWLLDLSLDDGLKRSQLKEIANFITVRSYQFSVHAVGRIGSRVEGTSEDAKPFVFRRFVAVYDKAAQRLVYFKDMS